ncbi:amidase [Streptomyces sp. NPDC057689]|uniref:amidase n=1 Tax=Streptomyces sp. NPDC057689 TaxID=3346213 RepID=UPI0036CB6C89
MSTTEIQPQTSPSEITELCLTPATELASRVRRRDISPRELTAAFLSRIEERNPALNAYVHVAADRAMAAAAESERQLMRGRLAGPLHGVPIAIKDLFDYKAGMPNTYGVAAFRDYVPEQTARHVAALENVGAIVLGKTNTPEFGHKGLTDNRLFGPTSTPFAIGMNSGGSSGGSAAALADGLCALSQGSDGGGSVRIPAALCGVVGFKPSFGRVADAVRPDAFLCQIPYMSNGPLGRSVEDCALLLSCMVGDDPRDPASVPHDGTDFLAATRGDPGALRAVYLPTLGGFPVEAEVRAVVDDAVAALEQAGVHVDRPQFALPVPHREATDLWVRNAGAIASTVVEAFAAEGIDLRGEPWADLPWALRAMIERTDGRTLMDGRRDQVVRTVIYDAFADLFDRYDLVISPTLGIAGCPNGDDGWTVGPDKVAGEDVDPILGWCLTQVYNFTGHPAISVPAGLTDDGLPVGLQIAGRRFADADVLSAAAAVERVQPWARNYRMLAANTR